MADLNTLINNMDRDGYFSMVARDPRAQFGLPTRRYIGAEVLPERNVEENAFRETSIKYRTVIANSGTRYSPSQKKAGEIVGEFLVELGESDIAREFTGRDYDILLKKLGASRDMEATMQFIGWLDTTVNRALIELNEKQRWDAIVDASVLRTGDNGYTETVTYSNPANHRVAAGGSWSSDAYDPYDDIVTQAQLLYDKGYNVGRVFTSRTVVSLMSRNAKIAQRTGRLTVASGNVQISGGRPTLADINMLLNADGLPSIETYDLRYRTQTGDARFLPSTVMVFVANTGRDETLDVPDSQTPMMINDVLGYTAVGRAVGQAAPGRVIQAAPKTDKPPRIEAEGWQTALPVITEPEAIATIHTIA